MPASIPHPHSVAPPQTTPYISASGRDLRLDLLRGLCVLIVIVDHVAGPSPLYWLTGGAAFFTSAAEGFILISGVTAGLVYRRLVLRDGLVAAMNKAISRAFALYLLCVGLTLFVVPVSEALRLPWANGLDLSRSLKFVITSLTLHQTYPYVNILLFYTLLFLSFPLALILVERQQTGVLLLVSWLLWFVHQIYPDAVALPWKIAGGHQYPFAAWQVLFFTAFALSYHRNRLPQLTPVARNRLLWLTGLAFAGLIALAAVLNAPTGGDSAAQVSALFDRVGMGPGRLFASAVVLGFLFLALTRWWSRLRAFGPLLLPFGQHALYAWTAHILVAMLAGVALVTLAVPHSGGLNAGLQITAVGVVWLMTDRQFLVVTAASRRYWYAAPAVLALFALLALQHPVFDAAPSASQGASFAAPARSMEGIE